MRWIHTSKCSFSEGFFPVLIWGYLLFHHSLQCTAKYHFAEHKIRELANSSKKGRVKQCVMKSHYRKHLWVSFPPVIIWGYFLFHHGPLWLPNLTLQIPWKECEQSASWELSCNSVRVIHRSQRSFSESFFHDLNWWYFLYPRRPQCDSKKSSSGSSETVIMDCLMKPKCNSLRWIHTSQRSF